MIHVLSFTAATFFVVGIVRAFWTAKKAGAVPAVVHSPILWAGLLTLAVIPVAHANHLSWPVRRCLSCDCFRAGDAAPEILLRTFCDTSVGSFLLWSRQESCPQHGSPH